MKRTYGVVQWIYDVLRWTNDVVQWNSGCIDSVRWREGRKRVVDLEGDP